MTQLFFNSVGDFCEDAAISASHLGARFLKCVRVTSMHLLRSAFLSLWFEENVVCVVEKKKETEFIFTKQALIDAMFVHKLPGFRWQP